MTYSEIVFTVDSKNKEIASDIVGMLNCGGIYIEDYTDLEDDPTVKQVGIVDEALLEKDKTKVLLHVYADEHTSVEDCIAFVSDRFSSESITYEVEIKHVDEEDYANSWKQYYKPIKIGNRVVIVPEWEPYEKADGEITVTLNPGMAFGTGTHETTSMCIEALQDIVFEGDEVLDIGCGSGILSVTALLCGANRADATDIDRNAVNVAYENAELNGVKDRLHATEDNILSAESPIRTAGKKYNVVIANIVADVIIDICGFVKTLIKPYGCFVASGIISERLDDVVKAMNDNGLCVAAIHEKRGWNCIIANPDTEDSV
ncbi:MAG: 50S ribosomal protein L11 methyltransferase [Clostridiales bacterium]|nr:50S ribosomal protein L11 methyltransferase [Clostridiales bacterium]